ncbi:Golgi apparatus membrane protein [Lachnellula hyalina]|uniref:Golgi apparatus membrane protein TVP38 n=1 Tax=Lachnellula hyalina TaxID=1316788 RepID=A0A8H8R8N6_9HELO|nr:Golgi apparatus membrane protein [Lachnellula hyalina]TVY30385.1 Golgi apparatus membrane protein [Lachnellula hyalina]
MPADYSSTAKALALPISPLPSPSPETTRPPWSRRISSSTRRANTNSPYSQRSTPPSSLKDQILASAYKVQRQLLKTFQSLSIPQRIAAIIALLISLVFGILFLVYSERIFGFLAPAAKKWHSVTGGWIILWLMTFSCAFPPLIGYSTSVTIAGFVYGFPNGWFIVASATIVGSLASFMASRTVLSSYVHRLVGQDKRFEALALTLKHDGLKILCMIRFCPLPYSLSNAAMSTFPTVNPLSFALATAISSPKLLIHVFIGSRLAVIAESEGGKMDAGTKAINYISIIVGGVLGVAVGWIIYQKTIARARELEIEELEDGQRAGDVVVGREYSDSAEAGDADAAALMNDDDISLWDNDEGVFEDQETGETGYRDELSGGEGDVFASGDADEDPKTKTSRGRD